jgi:hypothetical protein
MKQLGGLEALAGEVPSLPAKASSPALFIIYYLLFIIPYSLFINKKETKHAYSTPNCGRPLRRRHPLR